MNHSQQTGADQMQCSLPYRGTVVSSWLPGLCLDAVIDCPQTGARVRFNSREPTQQGARERVDFIAGSGLLLAPCAQPRGEALCAHDAVDHLAEQVGMAVVTGVFLDHMHQHPAH